MYPFHPDPPFSPDSPHNNCTESFPHTSRRAGPHSTTPPQSGQGNVPHNNTTPFLRRVPSLRPSALLALAGCILLCGCGSKDADNQTVAPVSEDGSLNGSASDTLRASMTVDNVTPGGLTVHFNLHEKRNEVLFGDSFRLEQRVGEDWAEVPPAVSSPSCGSLPMNVPPLMTRCWPPGRSSH